MRGWQWFNPRLGYLRQCSLTHKHTLWAHTLELSSTSHFTLISAEGPVPEWVEPVVSVCQNRWTLDPLSTFPAKQMTCLLLFPSLTSALIYSAISEPPPTYLPHCLGDINESKQSLLAWIAIQFWVLLFLHFQPQSTRDDTKKRKLR